MTYRWSMTLEDQMKTAEAEAIIRFLGGADHFGKEYTPYRIAEELGAKGIKTTNKRVKDLLAMMGVKFPTMIGYKKIGAYNLFWINASPEEFSKWFKAWFGKSL